jgi:3-isopropylmalate dehydrogenase
MHIAILAGDGIGPEVTAQAVKALRAVAANGPQFEFAEAPIGDAGFAAAGDPLPAETAALAARADAVLFGAAGTYESDLRPPEQRGGHALLRLRKQMDLFANYRPVFAFPELLGASTLKRETIEGVDLVVPRGVPK